LCNITDLEGSPEQSWHCKATTYGGRGASLAGEQAGQVLWHKHTQEFTLYKCWAVFASTAYLQQWKQPATPCAIYAVMHSKGASILLLTQLGSVMANNSMRRVITTFATFT
jgi:hypothetical protein